MAWMRFRQGNFVALQTDYEDEDNIQDDVVEYY